MLRITLPVIMMLLTGCAVGGYPLKMQPIPKPKGGYDAVRFLEFTTVKDHSINIFAFRAGSTLVKDREENGVDFYCGPHLINNSIFESCFVFEGNTIVVGYGSFKQVRRDLTGKIAHIKVNP